MGDRWCKDVGEATLIPCHPALATEGGNSSVFANGEWRRVVPLSPLQTRGTSDSTLHWNPEPPRGDTSPGRGNSLWAAEPPTWARSGATQAPSKSSSPCLVTYWNRMRSDLKLDKVTSVGLHFPRGHIERRCFHLSQWLKTKTQGEVGRDQTYRAKLSSGLTRGNWPQVETNLHPSIWKPQWLR